MIAANEAAKAVAYYCQYYLGEPITHMKLQKLLFFAQKKRISNNDKQCLFPDEIEAWQYGPVIPSVYHVLDKFGNKPIKIHEEFGRTAFNSLSPEDKDAIIKTCDDFRNFSAWTLSEISHRKGSAWATAMTNYNPWNNFKPTIDTYMIQNSSDPVKGY